MNIKIVLKNGFFGYMHYFWSDMTAIYSLAASVAAITTKYSQAATINISFDCVTMRRFGGSAGGRY
jgi:hypothetical protein